MKKTLLLLMLMLAAIPAFGQVSTTSVSGTISDANGQAFVSGTWSAVLIAASGGTGQPFVCNGITLSSAQVQQSGNLDSSGAFTATMVSNSCISPSGSLWQFTFNPAATSAPYTQSVYIFGTTQSLTSTITPPAITVNNSAVFTIAYTDGEVFGYKEGSFYWNVLTPALRVYHSGAWQGIGGSGSGVTSFSGDGTFITNNASTGAVTTTLGTLGVAHGGIGVATLTGVAKGNGTSAFTAAAYTDIAALWTTGGTCSSTTYLRGDGSCITPTGAISGGTTGFIPLFGSATTITGNSHLDDGITTAATITSTEPFVATCITAGTAPTGITCSAAGGFGGTESSSAGWTPSTGTDYIRFDSTLHRAVLSNNGGGETAVVGLATTDTLTNKTLTSPTISTILNTGTLTLPTTTGTLTETIASGTSAMGTSAISSGACATVVTTTATGVATTDTIQYTPNTNPTGITGYAVSATGSLYIWAVPTSGNVSFYVCNNTAGSLTPGALTLNWRVVR